MWNFYEEISHQLIRFGSIGATIDDHPERVKFWLENNIQVYDELSCTPAECLKCAISLLRDTAYQWWNTLVSLVPRERRFLDQKHKEFLELKQGQMTVTEYEREFVRLSKYAQEYVSTEEIMCKWFVDRLNGDIKLLVGILEFKEFVVLVDRACKVEELSKENRIEDSEARDSRKILMNRGKQYSSPKTQATSVSSVGSVRSYRPECQQCRRRHSVKKDKIQNARLSNTANRGRPPRNARNVTSSRGTTKDLAKESKARAPARAYAILAREDASSPDVITGTFSLYDTNVIALSDPGSTHLYICMNLVSNKSFPIESTEFVIKVSNPLG
ncbi:Gag-Pol polyprotein [Gossypium australe]|uniref:Gag-Pol polyprotein n=1 Tax=Gossypium australe TaxID=47621 RepID=A0A5B6X4Z9_9ROSI|nr:Gag-Pol polyprotein [Gossypium australe]